MKKIDTKKYQEKIVVRAMKDKNFSNELKKNPKKVLERELEITCPDNLKIEVIEQSQNRWVIVIPQVENASELSESELMQIAGGKAGTWATAWGC